MDQYWHKQTADQPLSTDLLWSRPENKRLAGKLLIIGGSAHGFRAPAEAYAQALSGGAGVARVILPDALRGTVQSFFPQADFAPSTPSGSLARGSLDILLEGAGWADAVLIAGDLDRNSETTIVLESFISKYSGPLIVAQDGVDHFSSSPKLLLDRKETVLVGSLAQLQKIATKVSFPRAFTLNMDLLNLVSTLPPIAEVILNHIRSRVSIVCITLCENLHR